MRKYYLIRFLTFTFAFSFSLLKAQYLWQVFADSVVQWQYKDGDEFNGPINEEKWRIGFPWGTKIFTQKTFVSRNNLEHTNGNLSFVLKRVDTIIQLSSNEIDTASLRRNKITLLPGNQLGFNYSGALLWSRNPYRYGYFELKFKGVTGDGVWPAFWLYGGNPNYEIDFFELKGKKKKQFTLMCIVQMAVIILKRTGWVSACPLDTGWQSTTASLMALMYYRRSGPLVLFAGTSTDKLLDMLPSLSIVPWDSALAQG